MKAPQQVDDEEGDHRDERVVGRVALQPEADDVGPDDAAKTVLAAGHGRPAEGHDVHHGGQRHGQQREVDAAPAQDEIAEAHGDERDQDQGATIGSSIEPGISFALQQRGDIGAKPEPGAMSERDEARIPDENVERHAGHGEDDDLGRRRDAEADRLQRERKRDERRGRDQKG